MNSPLRAFVLVAVAAVALAGCASSDGPSRPVLGDRVQPNRPPTPDGVLEVRETLAQQRGDTLAQMDPATPQARTLETHDNSPWYGPVFDVIDFFSPAVSWLY